MKTVFKTSNRVRYHVANRLKELRSRPRKLPHALGIQTPFSPDDSGEFVPSEDMTSLRYLEGPFGQLEYEVESADAAPTPEAIKAFHQSQHVMESSLGVWREIKNEEPTGTEFALAPSETTRNQLQK